MHTKLRPMNGRLHIFHSLPAPTAPPPPLVLSQPRNPTAMGVDGLWKELGKIPGLVKQTHVRDFAGMSVLSE